MEDRRALPRRVDDDQAGALSPHEARDGKSRGERLEGTSFGEVLDRLRHREALRYLADGTVSLQQIAWLLGYSEPGAFNHAFKRWTGTSPGRARTQRLKAAPTPPARRAVPPVR